MTHNELVSRAVKWLANTLRCSVVIREIGAGSEIPDAIGWYSMWATCLIEVKVSVSDFRADKQKSFRRDETRGMGRQRFYFVPEEIGDAVYDLIPDGWGLLVCGKHRVVLKKKSKVFDDYAWHNEMSLLVSAVRRLSTCKNPADDMTVNFYNDIDSWAKILTTEIER